MAKSPFNKLTGFTSDHTPQMAEISSFSDESFIMLNGLTWNLLNKLHSKTDTWDSNNPFDETDEQYVDRKKAQLDFLLSKIKGGKIDFMALQEVDIFTRAPLLQIVRDFLEEIRNLGWMAVHTDSTENMRTPLITFYDTNKLQFQEKAAVFTSNDGKKTALEATFLYKGTDQKVSIINMHLDHHHDYKNDILEYQQQQIEKNIFSIIAGDANTTEKNHLYGLVGDLDKTTKIYKPSANEVPNTDGGFSLKRADGFCASPANSKSRASIRNLSGRVFKWSPYNFIMKSLATKKTKQAPVGKYRTYSFSSNIEYVSQVGRPLVLDQYKYLLDQITKPGGNI